MNRHTTGKAVAAAKEFLLRAESLTDEDLSHAGRGFGTQRTGSLRRQSMELTRILAEMRRPQ